MGWRPLPDTRVGRAARLAGLATVALAAAVAVAFVALPLAVRAFVRMLQLAVNGSVWFAASLSTGADAWTIGATVARGVASALVTTEALSVVLGLILVSGIALYGLQRLLGVEQESSR